MRDNRMNMKKTSLLSRVFALAAALALVCMTTLGVTPMKAQAADPWDEILDYTIDVEINQDATVNLLYDISWKVLNDSHGSEPLTWVKIGIPNKQYTDYQPISDTIDYMNVSTDGGVYVQVYFKEKYYQGDVVHFQFYVTQDYMYQMNKYEDGYTVYSFTPGWFDEIEVDQLTVRWKADNVYSCSTEYAMEGDYFVFQSHLNPGERYRVEMTYQNDAYDFNEMVNAAEAMDDAWENDSSDDDAAALVGMGVFGVVIWGIVKAIKSAATGVYSAATGFGNNKVITRTKIEYYDTCQGCGGVREPGKDTCPFCNRSFIKSQETVTEKNVKPDEKDILKYSTAGTHEYTGHPNTFIRVNVVNTPKPRPVSTSTTRSSCAHSSCAHSSCACACACACAGGGRAGCTTKDFYRTNLKLKYLSRKKQA